MALSYRALGASLARRDGSFGPHEPDIFDFTINFEASFFTILPASCLILIAPILLRKVFRRSQYMQSDLTLWLKVASVAALVGTHVAHIVLWNILPIFCSDISLAASILSCVGALCIAVIVCAKHMYSYQPSVFIGAYLSITLLLDAAKSRSYFLRDGMTSLASLTLAMLALKLIIVILEEVSKLHLLNRRNLPVQLSRESVSGFWNRSLFLWLNSTLALGYKRLLKVEDLQSLGPEFESHGLYNRFQSRWASANKQSKAVLSISLLRTLFWEYFAVVPSRLCYSTFCLAQPLVFRHIIAGIEAQNLSCDTMGALLGAVALVYLGIAISRSQYGHQANRTAVFARGILATAIYDTMLTLSYDKLQQFEAVTLMTTDMDSIQTTIVNLHDIWGNALQLGFAVYIMTTIIGPAAFLVLIPTILSAVASSIVVKRMVKARRLWNEKIEARVAATSNVLAQLKSIKVAGLAALMTQRLKDLQSEEMKISLKERRMRVILQAIDMGANGISPVVAIAGALFWTRSAETLSVADIFTTLTLVAVVTSPLTDLLMRLPACFTGYASAVRVQNFLLLQEAQRSHHTMQSQDSSFSQSELTAHEEAAGKDGNVQHRRYAIALVRASLTSYDTGIKILDNVDLQICVGHISMFIGPVACGKSTLLRVFLREVNLTDGIVIVADGMISYCGETPWLQDMSIRDNIIGRGTYEESWYQSVVHACALDEDILQLAEGDKTMAGSGGGSLSGGQKQRVALARAAYLRPSIMFLDDALNSTDVTTSKKIISRLFGDDGIIRTIGATAVVTTHILEHLTAADDVFSFTSSGKIETVAADFDTLAHDPVILQWLDQRPEGTTDDSKEQLELAADVPKAEMPAKSSQKEPFFERQRGDFSLYSYYLRAAGFGIMGAWLLTLAVAAVSERMPQIYVRIWLDEAPENNTYFVGFAILGFGSATTLWASLTFYYFKIVPRSAINLHTGLVESVMKATLGFISTTQSGSLLNRFSQDMSHISQRLPMSLMEFSYLLMSVVIDTGIISSGATYAAAFIPFSIVVLYGVQHYYLRTSRQLRHLSLESVTPLYSLFTETTSGIEHIRAFNWQDEFMAQNLELLNRSQGPVYSAYCLQVWMGLVLDLCILGMALVLVAFALYFPSSTSATAIGLALVNLVSFSERSTGVMECWVKLETSLGSIARTREFNKAVCLEKLIDTFQDGSIPNVWPSAGEIEISNVTAAYNELKDGTRPVLSDISLTVEAGQKIGIVGRTGSGKSSLILTLLNFLEYTGTIKIDGKDIRTVPHDILRSRINTISQDGIELPGSLRKNLDPLNFHQEQQDSDKTMVEILTTVGLWQRLQSSGGLDMDITKFKLSGGEKQLLGIARAILREKYAPSTIVLMDEATSRMDIETDRRVQAAMADAFGKHTVLTIAHRIHAVENADIILEMQSGKIIKTLDRRGNDGDAEDEE